ncbi:hypothetical protein [Nesterenkonia sp. K-15-9-6]
MSDRPSPAQHPQGRRPTREECIRDAARVYATALATMTRPDQVRDNRAA